MYEPGMTDDRHDDHALNQEWLLPNVPMARASYHTTIYLAMVKRGTCIDSK